MSGQRIVKRLSTEYLDAVYLHCRRTLGVKTWGRVLAALDPDLVPQKFPDALAGLRDQFDLPDFICDLAKLEWAWEAIGKEPGGGGNSVRSLKACPGVTLCTKGKQNSLAMGEKLDTQFHARQLPGKMKLRTTGNA